MRGGGGAGRGGGASSKLLQGVCVGGPASACGQFVVRAGYGQGQGHVLTWARDANCAA